MIHGRVFSGFRLSVMMTVDVAVEREDAVGGRVHGRVAHERAAHEVAVHVPEPAQLAPQASFEAEHAVAGFEGVRSGHVGALRRTGNQRRELVACGGQGLGRERFRTFVGVGVDEESLAGGGVFVAGPDEILLLGGQQVSLRNAHFDAERLADGRFDAGVVVGFVGLDGAVALGLFEDVDEFPAVLREVIHHGLVVGSLKRQHDLRVGGDIVLHGRRGRLQRGIDDHFEDVAVVGDHARETAFGDAQHVEERFGLVQVGHRGREDRAQRISDLARPLGLGAYHDQLVGLSLRAFFRFVQGLEGVAARHRDDDGGNQCDTEDSFHAAV